MFLGKEHECRRLHSVCLRVVDFWICPHEEGEV